MTSDSEIKCIANKILIAFATEKIYMSKTDCLKFLDPGICDINNINASLKLLCKEGYLNKTTIPFNYYLLTPKGMSFFKSGGYKKQSK